jgi:hypothetical protein
MSEQFRPRYQISPRHEMVRVPDTAGIYHDHFPTGGANGNRGRGFGPVITYPITPETAQHLLRVMLIEEIPGWSQDSASQVSEIHTPEAVDLNEDAAEVDSAWKTSYAS